MSRKARLRAIFAAAGIGSALFAIQPAAAAEGCAAHLMIEVDEDSLLNAPVDTPPARKRLAPFGRAAGTLFARTADGLCRDGRLAPERLGPFRRLIVQNGSGAVDPLFYEDPHGFGSEDLIFQWIFADSDLQLPGEEDVATGLLCWAEPEQEMCAGREP